MQPLPIGLHCVVAARAQVELAVHRVQRVMDALREPLRPLGLVRRALQ